METPIRIERPTAEELGRARLQRLRSALADAPFDAVLVASLANVFYATDYRSIAGDASSGPRMAALVGINAMTLIGPCIDSAPALDAGIDPDSYVAYGRFYFESTTGAAAPTRMIDNNPDFVSAVLDGIRRTGLRSAVLGIDEVSLGMEARQRLEAALPDVRFVKASEWMRSVRAVKLPAEVALLSRAARLAEQGIEAALEAAQPGVTERQLGAVVASTMAAGGGEPRLVVVTAGLRSALADARPSDKACRPGELLRLDVGCVVDGYCSDVARTAVLGEPDDLQARRYGALLAGQEAELDAARAGVAPQGLFETAVGAVLKHGFSRYRRNHCGHGIGVENYEPPLVAPGAEEELAAGMVLCLETPYYELGWGGMMVEDTVAITATGHTRLTSSDRSLRVVPV